MEAVFISKLKPFLDAVAEEMELYVPKKSGDYYIFNKYDPAAEVGVLGTPFDNVTSFRKGASFAPAKIRI